MLARIIKILGILITALVIIVTVMAGVLALVYFGSRKVMKKGLSPIALIGISACLGILFFGI